MNPLHLCGECSESGPICCDTVNETANCSGVCGLRPVLSVQPYGAPALDVEFPQLSPIVSDNIVMIKRGRNTFNMSRYSNPFTEQLSTWTVSCSCVKTSPSRILTEINNLNCTAILAKLKYAP